MKNQFSLAVPAVNFHVWEPCNMRCKFCFATFQDVKQSILPKGHIPKQEALKVVELLAKSGFEKITFAGGEPTLCPWIVDLIQCAKSNGMTTMIVTNGSRISPQWLAKCKGILDWIALSIDSLNTASNLSSGRAISGKKPLLESDYLDIIDAIKSGGFRLKINTVVSKVNWQENMVDFIGQTLPERWKLFQVLPIKGQNSGRVDDFLISSKQFQYFCDTHNCLHDHLKVVSETNDLMTASYVMVDPAGRFFDNSMGFHTYSESIVEVGVRTAIQQVAISSEKFMLRQGLYDWG